MTFHFDFETTSLADFNKRARDPAQPHIVQFAGLIVDDDWNEVEWWNFLVKPEGWVFAKEAQDKHGITVERATKDGIPEEEVAAIVLRALKQSHLSCAFNVMFDKFIARIAMRRYDLISDSDDVWWKAIPTFCTMREMTPICKLAGGRPWKFPKLTEAYKHCFGEELVGAHDAMADVRACARIYRWLHERKEVVA